MLANPEIESLLQQALRYHQAGSLAQAEGLYGQILQLEPQNAEALHLLGVVAGQMGDYDRAAQLIRQAIVRRPNFPEACNNLGNVLQQQGDFDAAICAFRQAIEQRPNFSDAYTNLGMALHKQGRLPDAVAAARRSIELQPHAPQAYNNLGNALDEMGERDQAVAAYRQAIKLQPDYAEAHNNLGVSLKDQRRPDEAIAAFQRATTLRPDFAEAYCNLGGALVDVGQIHEGVAALRRAVALNPHFHEAHSSLLAALHYDPSIDPRAIATEHHLWNERFGQPPQQYVQPYANDRSPERRLRIGYVSPDFRDHPVGRFMRALLAHHDRAQMEIFAYSNGAQSDDVTQQLQGLVDTWRNIAILQDDAAAAVIRQDRIDILVDLAQHTRRHRLLVFARRPAPVQFSFAGYPGSTGLKAIGHRLSDPYLDPLGISNSLYDEQVIRLPHSFWCFSPDPKGPAVSDPPVLDTHHITFGCLNNFCKVNDVTLKLWARAMHRVAGSRLRLLAPESRFRQLAADILAHANIASERLEFCSPVPRRQYLELYHGIDISLDTQPYNGHTTSLDSYWMGVPVVTLVGQTIVGRGGYSQLMNLDLSELIAYTPDQFVEIVAALATDLPRLIQLRRTLRERLLASRLADTAAMACGVERAFRDVWREWCTSDRKTPR